MQVGAGAPTKRISKKKFNKQCELVLGPQQREFQRRNSTSNASWGWGPNKENFKKEIQQAMQVGAGAPTKRISKKKFN
ncbi:hypothetical protein WL514_13060, partial [Staphylococcus saprophyticus]